MKRTWIGFGDLRVGDRFRFNYAGPFAPVHPTRISPVMVKISPRKFRDERGSEWTTGAATAVVIERDA